MTDHKSEDEFVEELTERLNAEVEGLPETTRLRLQAMRSQATASVPGQWWQLSLPTVGLIGSAAVLALAVFLNFSTTDPVPMLPVVDEVDLAVVQDLELLEQLEFLAWLEEGGPHAG